VDRFELEIGMLTLARLIPLFVCILSTINSYTRRSHPSAGATVVFVVVVVSDYDHRRGTHDNWWLDSG